MRTAEDFFEKSLKKKLSSWNMSSFRISDPFSSMIAVFEFHNVSGRFLHLNEHVYFSLFHNLLDLLFDSKPSKNGNIFTICFLKKRKLKTKIGLLVWYSNKTELLFALKNTGNVRFLAAFNQKVFKDLTKILWVQKSIATICMRMFIEMQTLIVTLRNSTTVTMPLFKSPKLSSSNSCLRDPITMYELD